eukprot:2949253-Alexandrium_andersonii.AAC.1
MCGSETHVAKYPLGHCVISWNCWSVRPQFFLRWESAAACAAGSWSCRFVAMNFWISSRELSARCMNHAGASRSATSTGAVCASAHETAPPSPWQDESP